MQLHARQTERKANGKYKKYQEDAQYGYDKKGKSLNPKDIKKRNKKADEEAHKPGIEDWVSGHSMTATESLSVKDTKKLNKASALSYSDDPKDQDRARETQIENVKGILKRLRILT